MIQFNYITIKGFGSIKNLSLGLNAPGLNVVTGRNGSGKTTLFSGLVWCLFGKTLKNRNTVETWENLRGKDYAGTYVRLAFQLNGVAYGIKRTLGYTKQINGSRAKDALILIQDGEVRKDLRTKAETQAEINRILGCSYTLFLNSVVFGQKLKRIIQESGPEKKRIFEEAFQVSYISEAKKNAETQASALSTRHINLQNKLRFKKATLKLKKKTLKYGKEQKKQFEDSKAQKIGFIRSQVEKIQSEIKACNIASDLEDKIKGISGQLELKEKKYLKLKNAENALFKTELQWEQIKGKISEHQTFISNLKKASLFAQNTCSKCGQKIPKEKFQEEVKKLKQEISDRGEAIHFCQGQLIAMESAMGVLKEKIASAKKLKTKIESLENQLVKLENAQKERANTQFKRKSLEESLEVLENQRKQVESEKFVLDLKGLKGEVKALKISTQTLKAKVTILGRKYGDLKWAISQPLSNSGLKAYIFNHMLSLVNAHLSQYSESLGFGIHFGIDMESVNRDFYSMVTKNGEMVAYEDLSGGEQQLVDICIAFSVHDVISMEHGFNILILDEVFESLDEENIELVTELVNLKAKDKALYLVTHLKAFSASNSRTLNFKKSNKYGTVLVNN